MRSLLLLCFCAILASGCASITTGQNQSLSVETPGCLAATCKLSNDKGTWFVSSTPGSVTVQRAYGDMTVVCEKGEYKSKPFQVASATKAMAFGNILIGGFIGAAVDAGTGAAYDYPPALSVGMTCTGDPTSAQVVTSALPVAPVLSGTDSSAGTAPTAVQVPERAPTLVRVALPTSSKYMYSAEQLAKKGGCKSPIASMNYVDAGAEVFSIACANSPPLTVRCEIGQCRELQ